MSENVDRYKANVVHRNKTSGKTQWHKTISEDGERVIWMCGHEKAWGNEQKIFSLKLIEESPKCLDSEEFLNIACFVSSLNEWHGWPGNVKRSAKDLPPYSVLQKWEELKYTTRAKNMKLKRFQASSI